MADVDAVSAGFTSIVNGDGGAWFGIVFQLDNTLGYTKPEDIPAIYSSLGGGSSRLVQLVDKAMMYAGRSSPRVFRENYRDLDEPRITSVGLNSSINMAWWIYAKAMQDQRD